MDILTIVLLVIVLFKMIQGYKRGMVKEIISFVSLVILCVAAALAMNAVKSYMDREFIALAAAVILLCIVGILHHLLRVVFFSAKIISGLPVISLFNKILGMITGVLETVFFVWTVYWFIMQTGLGMIGQQILAYTQESKVLSWLYRYNYLAMWIDKLLP